MMSKFSSLKNLETFKKGNLSAEICASSLQSGNDAYSNIVDDFDEIFDSVKSEGGWINYGWGKRGLINDVSLLGNDIKEPSDNKVFLRRSQLMLYIFTHQRKIISIFLQFMGGLLTSSNLTFLHYKYVIVINPDVGMPL